MAIGDPTMRGLIAGADLSRVNSGQPTPPSTPDTKPVPWRLARRADQPPAHSCAQTLTLSFFFDGTGNNLDADVGTFKHSNVARLYRSHLEDSDAKGRFRFYLPGLGTYFMDREVKDPGGTLTGRAFGDQGRARLNWAFARFDEKVREAAARADNPTNKLCWIKVAVFGFSRGAALARAFCRDLQERCRPGTGNAAGGWVLKQGGYPIEIIFSGLFDTVASSGLPDSVNNPQRNRYVRAVQSASPILNLAWHLVSTPELKQLAFGNAPGADPAPGFADGHGGWADGLAIGALTRQCLHLIAAHEVRNSFPLESTLYEQRPNYFAFQSGCLEMVYPGVHCDVGGGYRPGEGGCKVEQGAQLSVITLRVMHEHAFEAGVPLRQLAAFEDEALRQDFAIDPAGAAEFSKMAAKWGHYCAYAKEFQIPGAVPSLGLVLNQHMRAFYAWRFAALKVKQTERDSHKPVLQEERVQEHERAFAADRLAIDRELKASKSELFVAQDKAEVARLLVQSSEMSEARFGTPPDPGTQRRLELANREVERRQVEYDRIRARKDAAVNDSGLNEATAKYDRILLSQAKQIVAWMRADRTLKLRPHYFALVDAYLDEYERHKGLRDAQVIEFFEGYVHDSLAGFDTDETWPSDPRIVYVGGDYRLRYAALPAREGADESMVS